METAVNMQTVEAIIDGSHKIDEMRKRIYEFVKMLEGLVNKKSYDKISVFGISIGGNNNMFWKIVPSYIHWRGFKEDAPSVTESFRTEAYIWSTGILSDDEKKRLIFCADDPSVLNYRDVQPLYDNLQFLLSGMIEIFPEIERKIKPFLDASEVV